LGDIEKRSQTLLEKKTVAGFLDKMKDSQEVVSLVEELRNAIVCYQVSENYLVLPGVNTDGTALAATVDVQSDRETKCKVTLIRL
jgi:hypothetical protein